MNKTAKRVVIGIVIGAVVVGGGLGAYLHFGRKATPVGVLPFTYVGMSDYWGDQSTTEGSITMENMQSVYLSDTQKVTEVYVHEGQQVQKGEPLLAFDTTLSDIELERQRITLEKTKNDLTKENEHLAEINRMIPYVPPVITPVTDPLENPDELPDDDLGIDPGQEDEAVWNIPGSYPTPALLFGAGTSENPLVYNWGPECTFTDEFIRTMPRPLVDYSSLGLDEPDDSELDQDTVGQLVTGPYDFAVHNGDNPSGGDTEVVFDTDGDTPAETGEEPTTETGEEPTSETGEEPGESTPPKPWETAPNDPSTIEPHTEKKVRSPYVYASFATYAYGNPTQEVVNCWGMTFHFNDDGTYAFTIYDIDPSTVRINTNLNPDDPTDPDNPFDPSDPTPQEPENSGYTAEEIAQMRSESQQRIKDLTTEVKVEEIKYRKMKLEMETGVLVADLDGEIKTLNTPEDAAGGDVPLLILSAGGGYAVTGSVGEFDLAQLRIGQSVEVMSYMSGTIAEGIITEISDQPTGSGWSNGNTNVSYYPFKVSLSDEYSFQEYEYVQITYGAAEGGSSVYLQIPYVLNENGSSYVYLRGEDGTLEKREVVTGKNLWNSYVEIRSGVTADDFIAFPYGKDVKPGAPTEDADTSDMYGGYYG